MNAFMIKMLLLFFCSEQTVVASRSYLLHAKELRELKEDVKTIEAAQQDREDKLVNLDQRLQEIEGSDFEQEIQKLEKKIALILNRLSSEKMQDKNLTLQAEEVLEDMRGKVDETEDLIEELKGSVKLSVDDFQEQIKAVNVSAQLTVNVRGVVFYGEIGTVCSVESGECQLDNSECRAGRCQCKPGLSYNIQDRTCVPSCQAYGDTYQVVENYIIRGHNSKTVENVTSIAACDQECQTAAGFVCRTIDFFPRWKTCYLSSETKADVPDKVWEYNSAGLHFQRDCAGR